MLARTVLGTLHVHSTSLQILFLHLSLVVQQPFQIHNAIYIKHSTITNTYNVELLLV